MKAEKMVPLHARLDQEERLKAQFIERIAPLCRLCRKRKSTHDCTSTLETRLMLCDECCNFRTSNG